MAENMAAIPSRTRELSPPRWEAFLRSVAPLALGVGLAVLLQFFAKQWFGGYKEKVLIDIGINIILAVSLNIVNGYTGQFSIGHAGFMAIGGYTAGYITYYGSCFIFGDAGFHGGILSFAGEIPNYHGSFWGGSPMDGTTAIMFACVLIYIILAAYVIIRVYSQSSMHHRVFDRIAIIAIVSALFVVPRTAEWLIRVFPDLLFLSALIIGGLVAALFGFIVGLPSLRLRGDYLAIVTLGFGEIVRVVIETTRTVVSPEDVASLHWYQLLGRVGGPIGFVGLPFYASSFWVWTCVTITLLVAYRIKVSSQGRAFLSIRENEIAAASLGVPTTRYKVRAFVVAAFFAGVAGGLFAHEVGNMLNPGELGFLKSFDIIIMVVLGGMGSISGATLAAIALTILPELLRSFQDYRMVIYALLLIIVMIVRPQGLMGVGEVWDFWKRRRAPDIKLEAPK